MKRFRINIKCKFCDKDFEGIKARYKPTGNFCSMSCNARFNLLYCKESKVVEITTDEYNNISSLLSFDDFNKLKLADLIDMKCVVCNGLFKRKKEVILRSLKLFGKSLYCSIKCSNKSKTNKVHTKCKQCDKNIVVRKAQVNKYKNTFCSYSCNAKFRNSNKKTGNVRSKIEVYLESKIREMFPEIKILPNDRSFLNGQELDFYFPDLKLAIELNGITHYEPIYGFDRLTRSQESDKRKMILCYEKGLELAVIDISSIKYFSKIKSEKILNEIKNILSKLIAPKGNMTE